MGIISKFVESQRSFLSRMTCDFRRPEENPALAGWPAIMTHLPSPTWGWGVYYFFEAFRSRPRFSLRMTHRVFMERGNPADACGGLCPFFEFGDDAKDINRLVASIFVEHQSKRRLIFFFEYNEGFDSHEPSHPAGKN
jgi:hypothetical protein